VLRSPHLPSTEAEQSVPEGVGDKPWTSGLLHEGMSPRPDAARPFGLWAVR
jgi:hypothetical protein